MPVIVDIGIGVTRTPPVVIVFVMWKFREWTQKLGLPLRAKPRLRPLCCPRPGTDSPQRPKQHSAESRNVFKRRIWAGITGYLPRVVFAVNPNLVCLTIIPGFIHIQVNTSFLRADET